MEMFIPLIALGGLYIISNKNQTNQKNQKNQGKKKEPFHNMGIRTNLQTNNYSTQLPNTNIPPQNYPIMNNQELIDNVQNYPNPNVATDKYFNQNNYEEKERAGIPISNNIQEIYSLSGNYLSSQEFKHNNMVPFDGGKPKGQIYNNNIAETLLDNYAGTGSQTIKKIEQAPLFQPQDNVNWTYGMPNMSEFYQSRVNPVNRNNMVKPFESEHVGPGLNQGYTTNGSNGFNSGMEYRDKWLPKNIDQLRVATNPKLEYSLDGHQGPAQSNITNVGIIGKVEKYKPDSYFINTQDRWLTTTGAEKAGQYESTQIIKPSHRNDTTTYQTGTPNAILKTASYVPKQYEETKRQQLDAFNVGASNAQGTGDYTDMESTQKSHTNYENNRTHNQQQTIFGSGFSNAIGAVIAPIMDIFRPSRREETSRNTQLYRNIGKTVPENYIVNNGDVPNTTIRETTLYTPHGYINNQITGNGYQTNQQQPISNQRDTSTELYGTQGINPASSTSGIMQYDHVYRQTNNDIKETTVVARTNQGNAKYGNSHINMSIAKQDSDRNNNRLWAPQTIIQSGPSTQTFGHVSHLPQYNQHIDNSRIDESLLDAFKSNPFTHSLTSVA